MNSRILIGITAGVSIMAQIAQAGPADLPPPMRRAQTVELGTKLARITPPEAAALSENVRNPFTAAPVEEVRTARPTSDKDLLLILSEQIQTTGVMGREDALILLVKGQKGVKVNEKLTLSFDGAQYEVEVIDIGRTNFSLRYNQAEITRPVKSGK